MSVKLKPLSEQVIVITGASSGIGLATAEEAVKAGASVVLAARSAETLNTIGQRLTTEAPGRVHTVVADVADRQQVDAIADAALQKFGRIDTWVNNAGIAIYGRLDVVDEKDSRRLFETNFWGVVNGSIAALPHLRKQGGALINVGSEVSEAVVPILGMYAASKHAVKGFTDALRIEVQEMDNAPVSITLIQPTATNTPFAQHAKNYLPEEPKLPNPMIDPHRVAEAILEAATKPTRFTKVGAMSKVNTAIAKFAPVIGEKMATKQADNLHHNMPAKRDRDGALYKGAAHGNIYGDPEHAEAM